MDIQPPPARLELGLDERKYHSHPALSKSALDLFRRSPYHYWTVFRSENPPERPTSQALLDGRMIHARLLEPAAYQREYAESSFGDRRTKAWKEFAAKCEEEGRVALTQASVELGEAVEEGVSRHEEAAALLWGDPPGMVEVSAFAEDEETGLPIRGRFDLLRVVDGNAHIVDLKTTADASPDSFAQSVRKYGYHRQAAMYLYLSRIICGGNPTFTFVVVEKSFPFAVGVYQLDADDIARGFSEIAESLRGFKEAEENDIWPQYAGGKMQTIKAFNY